MSIRAVCARSFIVQVSKLRLHLLYQSQLKVECSSPCAGIVGRNFTESERPIKLHRVTHLLGNCVKPHSRVAHFARFADKRFREFATNPDAPKRSPHEKSLHLTHRWLNLPNRSATGRGVGHARQKKSASRPSVLAWQ